MLVRASAASAQGRRTAGCSLLRSVSAAHGASTSPACGVQQAAAGPPQSRAYRREPPSRGLALVDAAAAAAVCECRQHLLRSTNSLCCYGFGCGEGVRTSRDVLQQQRRYFGRANLYLTSKQKSDTKRAGAFTKLCNEIWSAAKDGGTDPDGNHRLALAISKAKDANVPKANIERALARATETADAMEEVTYELYAPGGVGLIVAANTDSPNRTIRALKGVVKDYSGASMAAPGAVAWQFERTGLLRIAEGTERDMDKLMELAIDNGATDVDEEQVETDGRLELTVLCEPAELGRLCNEVRAAGFSVTQVMRPYLPTSTVDVQRTSDDYESLISFLDEIDAIEDVTDVFSNCRFS